MSRLASKPISIPAGISCVVENSNIKITKGGKNVSFPFNASYIKVVIENNAVLFSRTDNIKTPVGLKGLLGTTWALFKVALKDLNGEAKAKLNFVGVGYKASIVKAGGNGYIKLTLGFSHPIFVFIPKHLTVTQEKETLFVSGENTADIMQFCARVRNQKTPTVYHGTGVILNDEVVIKKVGKKK